VGEKLGFPPVWEGYRLVIFKNEVLGGTFELRREE
jgi:hypothetical protein